MTDYAPPTEGVTTPPTLDHLGDCLPQMPGYGTGNGGMEVIHDEASASRCLADSAPEMKKPKVVRSLSMEQEEILLGILTLSGLPHFDADVTYGNGSFYKGAVPEPLHKFDIDPQSPGVQEATSIALPLDDGSLRSIVFDPPFLTYVRQGRGGNGSMIMAKRFAGYWRYDELEAHYRATLKEAGRVLANDGILVMKCQDIVHNHRLHPTHAWAIDWAADAGLRLKDLYVLGANHRLPSPNRAGTQKHARIFHSYFLVFTRKGGRR